MNMMRWRTRFNALVHNELMAQMFDIEREYSANRMNIFFTEAIEDGEEIVVKMLVDMPHVEGSEVMVDFLDKWGNDMDLPVYPLVDETSEPTQFGDTPRLHIGFSVRICVIQRIFVRQYMMPMKIFREVLLTFVMKHLSRCRNLSSKS